MMRDKIVLLCHGRGPPGSEAVGIDRRCTLLGLGNNV